MNSHWADSAWSLTTMQVYVNFTIMDEYAVLTGKTFYGICLFKLYAHSQKSCLCSSELCRMIRRPSGFKSSAPKLSIGHSFTILVCNAFIFVKLNRQIHTKTLKRNVQDRHYKWEECTGQTSQVKGMYRMDITIQARGMYKDRHYMWEECRPKLYQNPALITA